MTIDFNSPAPVVRPDGRRCDELRPLTAKLHVAPYAAGSVLIQCGHTQVLCAATIENKVPSWMQRQAQESGWLTAEYSMLPYSTLERKPRDSSRGRPDGRGIEIQRLIGRSLRAITDLKKIPGKTIWIDCDVVQADGGTRTTAITGASIALHLAVAEAVRQGVLTESPLLDSVLAISVGKWQQTPLLDLCYSEDRDAEVDANIVMTGSGNFVEIQSSGEGHTFSQQDLQHFLRLASTAALQLNTFHQQTIASAQCG